MPIDALLASHNQHAYRHRIDAVADIAAAIRDEHIESLPVGGYDFWFTPSLLPFHRQVNRLATKILFGASDFNAGQVPLLGGVVVVTGRDREGQLKGLSEEEMLRLVDPVHATGLGMCQLEWRFSRAHRRESRRLRAERGGANRMRHFAS